MPYKVEFLPCAERQLGSLPQTVRRRVAARISALAEDPHPQAAKALHGSLKGLLCLRLGDYRVVYQIEGDVLVVLIIGVGHRRHVYKVVRRIQRS